MSLTDMHALWLEDRRLSLEVAAEAGVMSKDRDLGFPYHVNGKLRFTKWRKPGKDFRIEWAEGLSPEDKRMVLWGIDDLKGVSSSAPLILTEGEPDRLAWMTVGAPAVVSLPRGGTPRLGTGDVDPEDDKSFEYLWEGRNLHPELARFEKIILSTDNDQVGLTLRDELALRLGRDRCWYLTYPDDCKDANDVLMKYGGDGMAALEKGARPIVPPQLVPLTDIPVDNRRSYGVGWAGLEDHMLFRIPELVVLTGNAGSGKSLFALNLGANLARIHGLKGALLQFEDHPERNLGHLLTYAEAWKAEIPDARAWVTNMFRSIAPMEISDNDEGYTFEWIKMRMREAVLVHGCKWIIIDPWNEIEHNWAKGDNESLYTNRALAQLKAQARRLQIILIVVTHPGKQGAAKTDVSDITLYDVSGAAAWKNKADHGIILMRQEGSTEVFVKVDKVKDHDRMGEPGIVRMRYNRRHASYEYVGKFSPRKG